VAAPIQIDIVSDVVCPWCIVGFKQLEQALALHGDGLAIQVRWHPFELNPEMPPEGQELTEHVAEKYGASPAQSAETRQRIAALGTELGFAFNYYPGMRIVNTFQAHQLLHWAGPSGRQHALKMALFDAYFSRQERVDDPAVLTAAAGRAGLDESEAAEALTSGSHGEAVRRNEAFWLQQGIHGVPAMVFQERYLVSGAQGVEAYLEILRRLSAATPS
jgi:predicted DsbA family dithiol-disulfide isomerase